jgi:hypothetical protein
MAMSLSHEISEARRGESRGQLSLIGDRSKNAHEGCPSSQGTWSTVVDTPRLVQAESEVDLKNANEFLWMAREEKQQGFTLFDEELIQ